MYVDTMRPWLNRGTYISSWLPFVQNMNLGQVVDALPSIYKRFFSHLDPSLGLPPRILSIFERIAALNEKRSSSEQFTICMFYVL